jgi:dTDP-4-amino-4,6-dideoxygalactose transaminase
MTWRVPYFDLVLGDEEKQAALHVLDSNWLTSGPRIQEFEAAFARALSSPHAVAVSNCTAALHLALLALGVGPGDEVVVPSLTFVAAANAVRYCGATPVFADVCSETDLNVDPVDIERKSTPRTRVVMAMHYGGYPCDMGRVLALTAGRQLKVVEDACHGPLAEYQGEKLGTLGDVGCFSFFSNKNMTTGEGGMVVTRSAKVAERIKTLRSHGMTASTYERFKGHAFGYDVIELGYNYRLDEVRAAIGLVQLAKLAQNNAQRGGLVEYYRTRMRSELPGIVIPFPDRGGPCGYHIFAILLPEGVMREPVMQAMGKLGVQTSFHYRPIHTFTAYQGAAGALPVLDRVAPRLLSLPLYPSMSESQIDEVVAALKKCL